MVGLIMQHLLHVQEGLTNVLTAARAGNVIIYIPPSFTSNALAGRGIWYGRVEPGHVEGIVAKTIMEGKVIKELFRGGIDQNREILRL